MKDDLSKPLFIFPVDEGSPGEGQLVLTAGSALGMVTKNVMRLDGRFLGKPRWYGVSQMMGIGSGLAQKLCERWGENPDDPIGGRDEIEDILR